jgi:hypothetical protein
LESQGKALMGKLEDVRRAADILAGCALGGYACDPALDELYLQALASAEENGWPVESREEFELRYGAEMVGRSRQV